MAPHHVDLRRFCPALVGQWTPAWDDVAAQAPARAERTVVQWRSCFSPSERLGLEGANKMGLARGEMSCSAIRTQAGDTGNSAMPPWPRLLTHPPGAASDDP